MFCLSVRGNLRVWLSGLMLIGLASGCTLFRPKEEQTKRQTDFRTLNQITAARESVQLEVLIVERPLGDPLLEKDLWRELDTTSPFELHQRYDFEQQGFRVGVSGSNPSMALQSVMGSDTSLSAVELNSVAPMGGQRIPLPLGDEIELQTSPQYERCSFLVPNIRTDAVALQEFENVRCLFRLKAQEIEPGWVQLTLLPELHHGQVLTRRVATPGGWQLRTTQEVKPIFPQQFEMKLCTGEIAVISMMPLKDTQDDDLGYRFFVGADDQQQKQRVMIIRFAGMGQSRAVRVEREEALIY